MSAEDGDGDGDGTGGVPSARPARDREVEMLDAANGVRGNGRPGDQWVGLDEEGWRNLLRRIRDGKCTPFLGSEAVEIRQHPQDDPQFQALLDWFKRDQPDASPRDEEEACFGKVPSCSLLARVLAEFYKCPWSEKDDIARVAQFVATQKAWERPRTDIIKILGKVKAPDFHGPDDPHGILASLPLPVYITTTYYDFMTQALIRNEPIARPPVTERCRWHPEDREEPSKIAPGYNPSPAQPLVYHLYGQIGAEESLVLTEDDYLDFLMNTSANPELIPPLVQRAFTKTTLLFLGYHVSDLEFRILLRRLVASHYLQLNKRKPHLSVQVVAVGDGGANSRAYSTLEYLKEYCGQLDISVYPGTSRQFIAELKRRWEAIHAAN